MLLVLAYYLMSGHGETAANTEAGHQATEFLPSEAARHRCPRGESVIRCAWQAVCWQDVT
jgi:hypothetical protein